jgi:hypothetical protein
MTDGLTSIIEFVSEIIEGFDGMKGVLLSIGATATAVFNNQIAQGINNVKNNVTTFMSQFKNQSFGKSIASIMTGKT